MTGDSLSQPSTEHRVVVSQGDWATAKCSCRWYQTGWFFEAVEQAAKDHIKLARAALQSEKTP